MPYKVKIYRMPNSIDVEKNHTGRYGAPGQTRKKKRKATPEDIRRQNEWQAVKRLHRKIRNNFREGDYHVVLTYRRDCRPDSGLAKKIVKKFLNKLRAIYKKAGCELKYIVTTEYKSKSIHHHLLVNRVAVEGFETVEAVRRLWQQGGTNFTPLYETGNFKLLAEYLIKETSKTFRDEDNPNKLRYSCSRNLVMPEPEEKIVDARTWKKDPRPFKGYYIEKDSVVEGMNPITGHRYMYYTMIKIKKRE